jgi:hypothetical protein
VKNYKNSGPEVYKTISILLALRFIKVDYLNPENTSETLQDDISIIHLYMTALPSVK